VVEERFGFNKLTWKLWFTDLVKSTVLGAAIGLPIAALILWLMGAAGSWWWLWAWAVWMGFNLLLLVIYPTFIAPLFNKFQPLEDETLKARVTALMKRCGFAAKGLFVMDGSKRSAHANAYFTGFGAAKRVVFYDTLLAKLSPGRGGRGAGPRAGALQAQAHRQARGDDVRAEPGRLRAARMAGDPVWFYTGLGVRPNMEGPNDALALLLFLLAVPVFTYFVSPLMARLSRKHEFEADAYAATQTSGHDLGSALLKLYEDNASTLTPDPVFVKFYYSHPPCLERLARLGAAA
jgi:STE24 endopeptidase